MQSFFENFLILKNLFAQIPFLEKISQNFVILLYKIKKLKLQIYAIYDDVEISRCSCLRSNMLSHVCTWFNFVWFGHIDGALV